MGADLGYMLLIAFGSLKLTELYKEITRRLGVHPIAWSKSAFNLACCAVLTLLVLGRPIRTEVLIALGAAGLSALLHALDTVLRIHRDDMAASLTSSVRERVRRR